MLLLYVLLKSSQKMLNKNDEPHRKIRAKTAYKKELSNFLFQRRKERDYFFANGFNNGDPETNGEFETIKLTIGQCHSFIDVGYNKGEHSLFAEQLNQSLKIYGYEPNTDLPTKSSKHQIHRIALSDSSDTQTLYSHVDQTYSGVSSLFVREDMNPSFRKGFVENQTTVDTLDNSFLGNVRPNDGRKHFFLKIDTEGAEAAVLRGGSQFLMSQKVIGFFEYSSAWTLSKETLKATFYFLDNLGYSLFRITPYGLEHIRFFHLSLETYRYQNIFFSRHSFVKESLKSIEIPWEFSKTDLFLFEEKLKPSASVPPNTL